MERYENAYVYGIWFKDQLLYVGSSCSPLYKRKYAHKQHTTHLRKCCPVHYWIAENVPDMWNNVELRIEEIAKVPCKDKQELRRAEGEHIRRLNPSCNERIAGRTGKEWYEANREKALERMKNYREANKEELAEHKKVYREANKAKIAERAKAYRKANKEKRAEQAKAYYEANKEKRNAYHRARYKAKKLENKTLP
jgi:hypothetical protein